jgi:PEP-CTERM motif
MRKFFGALAALTLASTSASAAEIVGLYNTGVRQCMTMSGNCSHEGAGQKNGNGQDSSWDLVGDPQAFTRGPASTWIQETGAGLTDSRWITPQSGIGSVDPITDGMYQYFTTFDLTGFDAASAMFSGRFAVDNLVDSITLNGNVVMGAGGTFNQWTAFSASSGFVSGVNTLIFNVRNLAQQTGNPTGLRVEFLASDVAAAVPEPGTWAMLIIGFGIAGAGLRSQRRITLVKLATS